MKKGREPDLGKPGQKSIPQSHHNSACHDIAEQTKGHGYRRGKFADHIDREKDGQWFKQVFHESDSVRLDPCRLNQNKGDESKAKGGREIRRGRTQAEET